MGIYWEPWGRNLLIVRYLMNCKCEMFFQFEDIYCLFIALTQLTQTTERAIKLVVFNGKEGTVK